MGILFLTVKLRQFLGIAVDYLLAFDQNVSGICDSASQKRSALICTNSFMKPDQER